ncbi:type II toxin-antitoxin system VapB family antitoxin [Methylobacterium oryzisoli]|uniref:type II toxin-antitoxin system VapB family antitoxin n=1 Tax=Methylobacterium oryzisoli TaxID=3385502 RepID=UPI003892070F
MSIAIDHPEAEALLAEIEAQTGRDPGDLLLDLLRRERDRLTEERTVERRIAEGLAADRALQAQWRTGHVLDARSPDDVLGYDESGLPS